MSMLYKLEIFQKYSWSSKAQLKAIAALVIALLAYSIVPILIRFAEYEISPIAVIFHRLFIAALILGIWKGAFALKCQSLDSPSDCSQVQNPKVLGLLIGSGICLASTQILWAFSLTQTSVANSSLLHSFVPLFTTLGGWLIFAQKFDLQFIIGMIITIFGATILGFDDFLYDPDKVQGDIIALISALFFAAYFLLLEQIRDQFEVVTLTFYIYTVGTITAIPFLLRQPEAIFPSSWSGWLIVIALGCTLLLIYSLTAYALKWLSSGLITVVLLIEPAITAVLAWLIFSEALDLWNLLAFPIVLIGVYMASKSKNAIKNVAE